MFVQGLSFQEGLFNERSHSLVSETSSNNPELNAVKERCTALERECHLLREEKASLVQSLSMAQQDVELLQAEKGGLIKDLNIEKQKMKDLKEEIRQFSLAFAQREGLLTSLYTKSKAMMENLKSSRAPVAVPEL